MSIRTPVVVSIVVVFAMLGLALLGLLLLPPGAQVAVHWGLGVGPNFRLPKALALLMLPSATTSVSIILAAIPALEPRRAHLEASRKLYLAGWYGCLGVLGLAQVLVVADALGMEIDVARVMLAAVACLLAAIGNYLGKSRSMVFIGLRLPWTLRSEYAWEKSNRLAGRWFVATGIAALPVLLFAGVRSGLFILLVGIAIGIVLGAIAAYVYARREDGIHNGGSVHE